MFRKFIITIILVTFTGSCLGPIPDSHAQAMIDLPTPGRMVPVSGVFNPLELKGMQIYADNPLHFDFLIDKGKSGLSGQILKDETTRLIKYFLTCLTVPENDLWVNLSPYEKNRIAPAAFGVTEMGKSLLEQDYLLKQVMASLSYPENQLGKEFWEKVHQRAFELYGTTDIPINTFNKVWIVPQLAKVYVRGNGAFIVDSKLDVMLDTDYTALTHNMKGSDPRNQISSEYAQIVRDVILPQLRQEINEGKNFAVVRQVYTAMILATWYKRHLKDSLLGKAYVGKNKVEGVDVQDKDIKEKIFQQYLRAYKKCVYNYIREDYDPLTQTTVARKYASGGMYFAMFGLRGDQVYSETYDLSGLSFGDDMAMATVNFAAATNDGKIVKFPDRRLFTETHPFNQVSQEVSPGDIDPARAGTLLTQAVAGAVNPYSTRLRMPHYAPQKKVVGQNIRTTNPLPESASKEELDAAQLSEPLPIQEKIPMVVRPTRWLDISGLLSGVTLASVYSSDPVSFVVTTLALPFLTRISYAFQLWTHEVFGHGERPNYSLKQWAKVLMPWEIPVDNPFVPFSPGEKWDPEKAEFAFKTTVAIGLLSTAVVYFFGLYHNLLMPLVGPVGISAWAAIKASWSTDINVQAGIDKDKYECGNYVIFWVGKPSEGTNPSWVREGLDGLLRRLIVRGGQSAGQSTVIDDQFSTDGKAKLILTKVVKSKRGRGNDLVSILLKSFAYASPKELKALPDASVGIETPTVFGINGHVRYATGGPVSKAASHPFVGPQEERIQWVLKESKFEAEVKNVFVLESANGDNDKYRLLDREINLDEIRDFFPRLLHMKKDVWIPPTGMRVGYYDYLPLGDSPAIAPQIHFHLTQGSWRASARYAHVMINHKTATEAMEDALSVEQEDAIAGIFEQVFSQYAHLLSRPNMLNKSAKSYKDLWVTQEMVDKDPTLQRQYDFINEFKEALLAQMRNEYSSSDPVGDILRHWNQDEETRKKFVDMAVEKFFTGDRFQATQEFRQRANGTYGLVVRTSLQNDGVTIISRAQGMALGWNLDKKFFVAASDPLVLQGSFGERGRLKELFMLDPRGSGEVTDVGFSSGKFGLRVFSTEKQRDLTKEEILERGYPLNEQNPYYAPPVEYPDPKRITNDDLEKSTSDITALVTAGHNPQSFNSQSAEALVELEASRYVESYIRENGLYYNIIRAYVIKHLNDLLQNCLSSPGSCSDQQTEFLRKETSNSANDSVIAGYIQNKADIFIAKEADKIGMDLIAGTTSDEALYELSRQVDERLRILIDSQIKEVTDGLMNNFEQAQRRWQKAQEDYPYTNVSKKTDILITGYEKSLWLGEILNDMLKMLLPNMNVVVPSSNKFLRQPLQYGIHKRTIGLVNSLSGSTFPSLAAANLLTKMTGGNAFVITSRMDAMINMALGQRLRPDAPFTRRIFLTGNYYPSETAPTSDVLLFVEQISLVLNLVKRLKKIFPHHNPWGLKASDADIKRLEGMVQGMIADSRRITGFDEQRKPLVDPVNQSLVEHGKYLASHLLETPKVNFLFRVFVFGIFIFGAPIRNALNFCGADPGPPLASWSGFLAASVDAFLAMGMPFLLTTWLYRTWSHRPRWARLGPPTMLIGDTPTLHQLIESYVSKLGALAPGSMYMNVHGANSEDHLGPRFAHRTVRGVLEVFGWPVEQSSQDAVLVTLKQAHSIKNGIFGNHLQGGAEITTIGRTDFVNPDATDHHINIGGQILSAQDSDIVKGFYNLSFDPLGRLLAYKVMFNAMYEKASTFSIVPAFSLNFGLCELAVKSRKFQIWNRAWTFPSISVHTTRSPVGINDQILAQVDRVSQQEDLKQKDEAMSTKASLPQNTLDNGGIDMNSHLMNLDVENDTLASTGMEEAATASVSIRGFVPEIGTIVPVTPGMLQAMLGQ